MKYSTPPTIWYEVMTAVVALAMVILTGAIIWERNLASKERQLNVKQMLYEKQIKDEQSRSTSK